MRLMRKKFILFIVEGYNDQIEIDAMLHSPWFEPYRPAYEPFFHITQGDVMLSSIKVRNKKVKVTAVLEPYQTNHSELGDINHFSAIRF